MKIRGEIRKTYSTVPPCLRHKPSLVPSVTGGPVPAYISVGGSKAVADSGSNEGRLQPTAAPLWHFSRTASFSKPFYIGKYDITPLFPCQVPLLGVI